MTLDSFITGRFGDDYWGDDDEREWTEPSPRHDACDACQLGAHGHCRGPRPWRPQGCKCQQPQCVEWNAWALTMRGRG